MFKMLEKLINEHGSANILKERLGLKDDQIKALKQEFSDLKTQNKNLKATLDQANQEKDRLNKIIQSFQKNQGVEKTDKVSEQILQQFFKMGKALSSEYFVSSLSLEISVIKYHFDILINYGYIDHASFDRDFATGRSSTTYLISPKGREYIMKVAK